MHIFRRTVAAAAILAAVGTIALDGVAGQEDVPAELEDAIRANVEARGEEYAGPCTEATTEDDVGTWCSHVELRDDRAIVSLGPTFSEFVSEVVFTRQNGTWAGVENGRSDPAPTVPDTGTGTTEGSPDMRLALAVAAAGAAALAGGFLVRRRGASAGT